MNTGGRQGPLDILAPDVVILGDGGGVARAAPEPVVGAGRAARLAAGPLRSGAAALRPARVNGCPALVLRLDGRVDTVIALHVADGRVAGLYAVRNPGKLSRVEHETVVRR